MTTSHPSSRPRIILTDDHEWILQILVKLVEQTLPRAEIVAAESGLDAFEAYERGGADFVVTNHLMPEMDGPTLIRRLRAQAPDLPILMVSADPENKADAREAGANWFLSKKQITERLPGLLRRYTGSGRSLAGFESMSEEV